MMGEPVDEPLEIGTKVRAAIYDEAGTQIVGKIAERIYDAGWMYRLDIELAIGDPEMHRERCGDIFIWDFEIVAQGDFDYTEVYEMEEVI